MKRSAWEHPKFDRLMEILGISYHEAVGIMECIWHCTSLFAPQGNLGEILNDKQILLKSRINKYKSNRIINALCEAGFLDRDEKRRLLVHDWHEHAPDWVKKKLKREGLPFLTLSGQCPDKDRTKSGLPMPMPMPKGTNPPCSPPLGDGGQRPDNQAPPPGPPEDTPEVLPDFQAASPPEDHPATDDERRVLEAWLEHTGKTMATLSQRMRTTLVRAVRDYLGPYTAKELCEIIPKLNRRTPWFGAAMLEWQKRHAGRAGPDTMSPERRAAMEAAMKRAGAI